MSELIGIQDISMVLNVSHAYVRDRIVKRPDFPRPSIALSQKCRRWSRDAFEDWVRKQTKQQAR